MKQKIIIIDDDEKIRNLFEQALKQEYEILHASNGLEGLELINKYRPDLIILDLSMPEMDGFQTLELLREDKRMKNLKVVMITVVHDQYSIKKLIGLGVTDYIIKPFPSTKKLLSRIKKIFNKISTILVIDDDVRILNLISNKFSKLGYRILTAEGGDAGLYILRNEQVNLILSDLFMPDTSGMITFEKIKSLKKYPPVLIMKTNDPRSDLNDKFIKSVVGFIQKPIDISLLFYEIKRTLNEIKQNKLVLEQNKKLEKLNAKVTEITNQIKDTTVHVESATLMLMKKFGKNENFTNLTKSVKELNNVIS